MRIFCISSSLYKRKKSLWKQTGRVRVPVFSSYLLKRVKHDLYVKFQRPRLFRALVHCFCYKKKKSFFFWSSSFKSSNYQTKHAISRHNQQENTPSTKTTETNLIIVAFLCERLEKLENQIHKLALVGNTKGWRYRERVCVCIAERNGANDLFAVARENRLMNQHYSRRGRVAAQQRKSRE